MKDLINAAMATAKREGMKGAIILFGDEPSDAVAASAADDTQEALARCAAAEAEVDRLRAALQAPGGPAPAVDVDAITAGLQQEVAALQGQLATETAAVQALTTQLGEARQSTPPTGEAPPMGTEVVDLDAVSIDLLGLEDKIAKAVKKNIGAETVGALRVAYMGGDAAKFRTDTKLTKDQVIQVGMALAGKLPSLTAARAAAGESAGTGTGISAPAVTVNGGAPMADRPWPDRFAATLTKEMRMKEEEAKVAQLRADAQAQHPAALENGNLDLAKLPKEMGDAIRLREGAYNVVRGQVIAGMWHCGLMPTAGTLVAALEQAGVTPEKLEALSDSQGNALVWPAPPVAAGA